MAPDPISGKTPRKYRSALRQQQAEATRQRVVAAAAELFAVSGYARTTVAKIAAAAGVSAETVQGQGSKAELLIAAVEQAAVGVSGEENILNLEIGRRYRAVASPAEAAEFLAAAQTEMHERSAGLALALSSAANDDPELDRRYTALVASITGQDRRVLEIYRDRGWLRDHIPFDELVETAAVLNSIETFVRITRHDGWPVDRYRAWLRRMLTEVIFLPLQQD